MAYGDGPCVPYAEAPTAGGDECCPSYEGCAGHPAGSTLVGGSPLAGSAFTASVPGGGVPGSWGLSGSVFGGSVLGEPAKCWSDQAPPRGAQGEDVFAAPGSAASGS
ncbi:hypothetical protein [Fodinicola feengrottensis]|uniref:hypothetical protein n=1 Tax=Fodinicola feengrottensis TaxID=435914 RepID=UPI0013D1DBBC|nr:hypothetical protein [Fodinicola feengrottensis]